MDNQILSLVMMDFAARRMENEQEEARRMEEITTLHPDLQALLQQRHSMVMKSVTSVFSGEVALDAEALMADYNQKISALLEKKGYPADYLAPVCQCKICQDAGYIYENSLKKPCECLKKAYLAALSQASENTALGQCFEAFDESRFPDSPLPGTDVTQREYMRIIRGRCLQYAENIPHGPIKTLLLHGGSGLGKTFLLHCVGNHARARGVQALFVTAYDLLMALKTAYFSRTGESAQEYFDAPLLLIDDLGMEPLMENITVEQIYALLSSRMSRGLYTVITSNLSRTELEKRYTERVSSRLLDTRTGMALPFQGKDIRLLRPEK
ncbi:MAG: hypothetical protein E7336_03650 [Clostridiales bacterium]|nr:hypothetical protein [Clostridiales bacterium]